MGCKSEKNWKPVLEEVVKTPVEVNAEGEMQEKPHTMCLCVHLSVYVCICSVFVHLGKHIIHHVCLLVFACVPLNFVPTVTIHVQLYNKPCMLFTRNSVICKIQYHPWLMCAKILKYSSHIPANQFVASVSSKRPQRKTLFKFALKKYKHKDGYKFQNHKVFNSSIKSSV